MIPNPEQLEEISRRREGSLKETPFPILLYALARHERTVVLEIRRRQLKKDIIFEYGVPVDTRSNLVHETLGRFMVSLGRLSEEEHDECLRESITRGARMGEVLRERGLVDSFELFKILQQNLAKKLLDGFTWSDGEFLLRFDVPEVESPLKVRVPQLLVTGITRFSPQEEVNAAVWPLVGQRLVLHPAPDLAMDSLKMIEDQRRVVERLSHPQTIKELASGSALSFDEVTRLIYALALLGAVILESARPEIAEPAAPETAAEPVRRWTAPGTEAVDPATAAHLRNQVMEAYLAHRGQDAFDLLGVAVNAPQAVVREEYLRFARWCAPWRFETPELAPIADKAADLFLAGARAYSDLADTERRNTLTYRRKVLAEEKAAAARPDFSIKTDLLDPEKQYRKGRELMDAESYRDAVEILEFASDCDPTNPLYRSELAWCRYLDSPAAAAQALEELDETLRMAPKHGLAAYYAGEIHRRSGDVGQAERYLRRANQLMAPDRRPIEALKALARHTKRR